MQVVSNAHVSLRQSRQCYDYARNILVTAPPNAVLVDNNDVAGYPVFMYLQQVDGVRRDVVVVNREAFQELLDYLPGLSVHIEQIMSKRMGRGVDLQKEVADAMSSMNQA